MKAILKGVGKRYGDQWVLRDLDLTLEGVNVLMAPSGRGKTTLARLLLGLEQPDSGSLVVDGQIVAQFQEDRLCSQLSAVGNVALCCPQLGREQIETALARLGLCEEDWAKPARQLSGGQARRVALARALLAPAEGVILDEPFKGLDEETRQRAMDWVHRALNGRWLLLITHDEQEAGAFGGASVVIPELRKN